MAIIGYLRILMRGFQETVYREPSSLYSPHLPNPMDTMECTISYHQMYSTKFLDRFLDDWTLISAPTRLNSTLFIKVSSSVSASAPRVEYARPEHAAARTIHDGVKLLSPDPSRWASTHLWAPVAITFHTIDSGPFHYLCLMDRIRTQLSGLSDRQPARRLPTERLPSRGLPTTSGLPSMRPTPRLEGHLHGRRYKRTAL